MPEKQIRKNTKNLELRAKMPFIIRVLAIFVLFAVVVAIGIGFYQAYGYKQFRMKSFPTALSEDVVAEVNGYERTEADGDIKKYYVKAEKARTYADNHQEMENIYLQVYDEKGDKFDTITASKAVYLPAKDGTKNFTAYFAGAVNVATRDALQIKTEQVTYTKETETVDAEEEVEFSRENVSGKSYGAQVKIKEKTLELLKDVEINAFGNSQEFSQIQSAHITAGRAFLNQLEEKIELNQDVFVSVTPNASAGEMAQPTDIKTDKAIAHFKEREIKQIDLNGSVYVFQKPTERSAKWSKIHSNRATVQIEKEVKRLELFENVDIETTLNDAKPTKIKSNYALYEKDADRFELKNGVEILTVEDNQPTKINASEAIYEQSNGRIFLNGNAEITEGDNYIKGDKLTAELFPNKKLKTAHAYDNAFLRQVTTERTTEISSNQLSAVFNDSQQLQTANATGASRAVLIPAQANDYTRVTLTAPNAIRVNFSDSGLLEQMQTDGRTTIFLNAPNNRADAANKKLTADSVKTSFHANGKDLAKAEAVGNAELYVEPLRASAENYRTTINAPRFDCDFFDSGNNARSCSAGVKAKVVRVPTVPTDTRGNQTLVADKLNAAFGQSTQDVEQLEAVGNTKFSELDRNGIAERIVFTANDGMVRLRGGEPTVWDSNARAKAGEIDWDTRGDKSVLRGKVSTTYYSQNQTGGATPFGDIKSPVFVTSDEANFDHRAETAVYTGNARAWQESNYVRADRLTLNQKEGKLFGEGSVQSVLYNAKQTVGGKKSDAPVSASSQKIFYSKESRQLRYEGDVDIRQGTDRITAGVANVYLKSNNELSQTVAENNVIVTQPNRRATGDWAQYTADTEMVVLRGNPARIEDAENGSSQSAQLTVNMRTKNVVSESKTTQTNTGRIRSVYKIKKPE
ncbi:MAG TPA: LPS export ABC transporter periplasmic protein LptC [Pyrinomonadaceae bacterium]|jgi:lipopolysaccharide export system protein LptA